MVEMLRWGLLGASRAAARWVLPAIQAEPGHAAVVIGARDGDRARAFAGEHGIPRACQEYEAVIADPEVDAVYIGLTNDAHLPWTLRALAGGRHVLCEKPLAMNAAEVERMRDAQRQTGRLVLEAFAYRFHPQIERLLAIIASGALGPLVSLEAAFTSTLPAGDWRWNPASGGGALLDVGCYAVNALHLAAGRGPQRVSAAADWRGGVDATLSALLDFGKGLAATLVCSVAAARGQHFVARGTQGFLRMSMPFSGKGREVTIERDGETESFAPCDPARGMIAHFAQAIRGETPLRWPLDEALEQARTLDALLASARSGGCHTAPLNLGCSRGSNRMLCPGVPSLTA